MNETDSPSLIEDDPDLTIGAIVQTLISATGVWGCLAVLFMGMRGVMELGGFVASGGPYEIAHPAPGWAWIMPASIVAGMALGAWNLLVSRRAGAFPLLPFVWSALFISLGWNFLEFGLSPPGGSGPAWGWLVSAAVFLILGAAPLPLTLRGKGPVAALSPVERNTSSAFRTTYVAANVVALAAGIALGLVLYSVVSA